MAKMTGSNFLTYVKEIFKRDDKDTELYEIITDVVQNLRATYFFEDYKKESYTDDIASLGDYKLTLPSEFRHLIGDVVLQEDNGTSRQLIRLTKPQFDEKYPHPNDSNVSKARPVDYCIFSGQVLLGPVPDSTSYVYQITHSTEDETAITSATTEVPFTDRWRWVVRNLVLGDAYDLVENHEEGTFFRAKGEAEVRKMVDAEKFTTESFVMQAYRDF